MYRVCPRFIRCDLLNPVHHSLEQCWNHHYLIFVCQRAMTGLVEIVIALTYWLKSLTISAATSKTWWQNGFFPKRSLGPSWLQPTKANIAKHPCAPIVLHKVHQHLRRSSVKLQHGIREVKHTTLSLSYAKSKFAWCSFISNVIQPKEIVKAFLTEAACESPFSSSFDPIRQQMLHRQHRPFSFFFFFFRHYRDLYGQNVLLTETKSRH